MKCDKCGNEEIQYEFIAGKIFCKFCGFVIEEGILSQEISFDPVLENKKKTNGQIMKNLTINKTNLINKTSNFLTSAKRKINQLCNTFKLPFNIQDSAIRLFLFALHKGFIIGKKIQALCISCIYIICRKEKTSHLLVDFSDITQSHSNKIGTIFLKFLRNLNICLPVIDPSLFVHRFAINLRLGNKTKTVARSALRIIARMKRDWMSTGRRPSGLCGAALLLASRMHGFERSQKEIAEIVRIGNVILRSRLREIDQTSISNLTIYDIDRGGGDDGNKESLLDNLISHDFNPPSIFELVNIQSKKKEEINKNSIIKKEKKINKKNFAIVSSFCQNEILKYVNTNLEIHIKKDVWSENNLNFICSQSIIARAQKEKPFAFFKIGKKIQNNN